MKHLFSSVFFFLFLSITCFAQNDFKPGYILQKGDTIKGFVNYKGDKRNAQVVTFKRSEGAPATDYYPKEISGYGLFGGALYEVRSITTADSTYSVFLTILVKGRANLYSYRDNASVTHFLLDHRDSLQELVVKKQLETMPDGRKALATYNYFRSTLEKAFQDCPAVSPATKRVFLNERELTNIVSEFNQCADPAGSSAYVTKPRATVKSLGLRAGVQLSTIQINGMGSKDFNLNSTPGYHVALMLNSTVPLLNPKLSVQVELQYDRTKFANHSVEQYPDYKINYTFDLNFQYIRVPLLIRYTFPKGGIRPFVNAGFVNGYAIVLKQTATRSTTYSYSPNPEVKKGDMLPLVRNHALDLTLGGGVIFPAWTNHRGLFEARYGMGFGFSDTLGINTNTHQLQFTTGIYL